jgi:hypothetical protein
MPTADIDRRLTELREAVERIGANLVDLELAADVNPVGVALLEGESATAWEAAEATQLALWSWYGLLTGQLERAAQLRGTRGHGRKEASAELEHLLAGPSIELHAGAVPLASRGLLDASWSAERCSCDELLEKMTEAFAESTAMLGRFTRAWDVDAPRVRAADLRLDELDAASATLARAGADEIDRARRRASELEGILTKDPLSIAPGAIDDLDRSVEAVVRLLESVADFGRSVDDRLAAARALLDDLVSAAGRCAEAHHEVERKIARPDVPAMVAVGQRAALELDGVRELVDAGAWEQACLELARWTAGTSTLLEKVRANTAETLAPLELRDELRGRLRAYQAKAARIGVAEDRQLLALFERAIDALYVVPADLLRAERLVVDYQRALVHHRAGQEVLS